MPQAKGTRADFGQVLFRESRSTKAQASTAKKRPGRWAARYTGPDGKVWPARTAGGRPSFEDKDTAHAALRKVQAAIEAGTWTPPDAPPPVAAAAVTFEPFARNWLANRRNSKGDELAVRTRESYEQLLEAHIYPVFGDDPLDAITPAAIDTWYAGLNPKTKTTRAHSYALLKAILATAVDRDLIVKNPCRIRGAGQTKRARKIRPATLPELAAVVSKLPERYRLMALLAAWCQLRFGELAELRRGDVVIRKKKDGAKTGVIRVTRGVVRTKSVGRLVKDPKSEAGVRDVAIPPHLIPAVEDHLRGHVGRAKTCLLFPAAADPTAHMMHSTLNKVWRNARAKGGRPDLAFHDLRHTGATLAAATGATLAELMSRLGHSTPSAAMLYQHAAADRDQAIAEALSGLVDGT